MAKKFAPVVESGIVEIPTDTEKLSALMKPRVPTDPMPTPVMPEPEQVPVIPTVTSQDVLNALRNDPALVEAMRNLLAPPAAAPRTRQAFNAGSANAVPTIRKSAQKAGFVEFSFSEKPDEAIRTVLKAAGYRWSKFNKVWYGPGSTLAGHATFGPLVQSTLTA